MNNKVILLLEGQSEESYIKDFYENHGEIIVEDNKMIFTHSKKEDQYIEMEVIKPNKLSREMAPFTREFDIFYIIMDNDDVNALDELDQCFDMQIRWGVTIHAIIQESNFEWFVASHWEDFQIPDKKYGHELNKIHVEEFIKSKGFRKIKKINLTMIEEKGGQFKHTKRFKSSFGIIKILKK